MTKPADERVICLPAKWVNEQFPDPFTEGIIDDGFSFMMDQKSVVMSRSQAETSEEYKHLVSYTILDAQKHNGPLYLFSYARAKSGAEPRLHSRWSIGVGGHLSADVLDELDERSIMAEIQREINEELIISTMTQSHDIIGFINDNSDPVGRVHLGIVSRLTLWYPDADPREDCLADGQFDRVEALVNSIGRFESWSQILIRHLFMKPS